MISRGMAQRIRAVLLAAIGVLYVISIPWYREAGEAPSIIGGFPDWAAFAIICYVGVAILNCAAWLLTEFPDEPEEGAE